MNNKKLAVYLNLTGKTLLLLGGIILVLSFVFLVVSLPALLGGGWENVFFLTREALWKLIFGGLFTVLLGMIFYIIVFLRSGK